MTAAASFGLQRSGKFANGSVGSGLSGRISEAWPTLAPPGECFAQAPRKNFHAAIDAALRRWSLAALAVIAPRKPSLLGEKRARLVPDLAGELLAQLAAVAIAGRDVNAATDPRPAGLPATCFRNCTVWRRVCPRSTAVVTTLRPAEIERLL
jgi:hypothetical protein